MAWFGDSLSSLSNLKGQITNFTKEVLSDGIVEEVDERTKALNEANERCVQLQDLLNTKDAEISLLRRQNCELQRAVIEINAKSKESNDTNHIDETEGFFWDPSSINNRNTRNQNHVRLQEQLAQATVKVRDLECELRRVQKVNTSLKDDIPDGQKAEVVRAKQDMMNRIIQMEEKTREAERNAKHIQLDEASLINDFRLVISKLNSREKFDLIGGALKALQIENDTYNKIKNHEIFNEGSEKIDSFDNPLTLKHHFDTSLQQSKSSDTTEILSNNKQEILQKRIDQLENENKDLLDATEKLDEEHTQSIEKLLSLREETIKKHRTLENAYEQLSTDYKQAQKNIIELQKKLDRDIYTEISYQSVQTDNTYRLDKHTQIMAPSQGDDATSETSIINDITQKVKMILKNYTISSIESGESIFEAIAKQYIDTKWKLDVLERKVTEITRDLKETEEIKESLQIECEELQSHIDSLLLENQALKSNLPSIPEAGEERVASLEMDVESLREEMKCLLAENKTIRETNSTLMLVTQSKGVSSTNHDHSQEDLKMYSFVKKNKELSTSLENNKSSDEDIISINQLKLDYENVKQELKLSMSKSKLLENNLASQQDTVNKLTEENKDLIRENKNLDIQLCQTIHQESGLQKFNDSLLSNLQQELDTSNREKFDCQNDILRKKEELDQMRIQIDANQFQIARLNHDNDRLAKENASLLEQLTATHDESLDKIELLNTELSLLQQEHEDLKQETSIHKEELTRTKKKLCEVQEHYTKLENEYHALKIQCERLEVEKGNIQSQMIRKKELENNLNSNESLIEELSLLRIKCKYLEQEIEMLHAKETQLSEVQKHVIEISSANIDETNIKVKEELSTSEDNLDRIENIIKHVKTEKQDLSNDNKQQTFELIDNEERQEKDIIKAHNENLMDEIIQLHSKLQTAFENNKESSEMAKQTIEDLSHLIRKKDEEISILQAEIIRVKNINTQISNEFTAIKNQKVELELLISVKHNESLQYQNEIQKLMQSVNEQAVHIQELISEQTMNEIRNKANIEERLKNLQENHNRDEINQTVDKQKAEIATLNKKCDALEAALMQEQSNNRILQNQLAESQNKEANSAKELERLRTHLVEMESSYTEEALIAENSRQELEARLLQAEEKVKSSSTAFTSANIRANQQVETLQQQISLITQQRDNIQAKLSAAEDNILLQSASLTNLQIVLEQFQQDKESDIMSATEKIRSQLKESYKKQDALLHEISILKQQLSEAKECLQAASRLSEQLEKKDEQIERLNEEVARLTTSLNSADQRMKEAIEHEEGKVDKILIKNLLLGYLSSTTSDKSSILRVFANILDFTESEKNKTGLNSVMAQTNWFLSANKSSSASLKDQEASLSAAFVRFLESESKPKPQLPALPMVDSSSRPGYNKQQSSSSTSSSQSTLLMSNVALPTFPDFIPSRNTGSILKEVLKDS